MNPTIDRSHIVLTMNVDETGTPSGGGGGGGGDASAANQVITNSKLDTVNTNIVATNDILDDILLDLQDSTPAAVMGAEAHDTPATIAPVSVAGVGSNTIVTPVAEGDVTRLLADLYGRLVTTEAPRALTNWTDDVPVTTTSPTTLIAAGAAGFFRDLTGVTIQNSSATATTLTFSDGTKSFKIYVPATAPLTGFNRTPSTARKATAAATAWTVTSSVTVASGLSVTADYVERKA